jgi:hypothetical protein
MVVVTEKTVGEGSNTEMLPTPTVPGRMRSYKRSPLFVMVMDSSLMCERNKAQHQQSNISSGGQGEKLIHRKNDRVHVWVAGVTIVG